MRGASLLQLKFGSRLTNRSFLFVAHDTEQQCRAYYEDASRKQEAEILTLKTRLEEQLENEKEWEVERARLHDELKSLQEKGAEEAQRWLAKIGEAGERAIQLERDMRAREEQFERALEEKEEESRRKLEEARGDIDRETKEKEDLKAQVAALQAAGPAHAQSSATSAAAVVTTTAGPPPAPPPGPPGPPPPSAPSPPKAPKAPAPPAVTSSGALAANSRDALLAAIKNPSALQHVVRLAHRSACVCCARTAAHARDWTAGNQQVEGGEE